MRDERDTQRSASPLQQAPGASLLDTTALSIDEAVQDIEQAALKVLAH
jgi:cytidylate kinase